MADDVARIAAELTRAQQRVLLRHCPNYGHPDDGWPGSAIRDAHSFAQAGRPLMDAKLISWTADRRSSETTLTPIGLAVRQHLEDQSR